MTRRASCQERGNNSYKLTERNAPGKRIGTGVLEKNDLRNRGRRAKIQLEVPHPVTVTWVVGGEKNIQRQRKKHGRGYSNLTKRPEAERTVGSFTSP